MHDAWDGRPPLLERAETAPHWLRCRETGAFCLRWWLAEPEGGWEGGLSPSEAATRFVHGGRALTPDEVEALRAASLASPKDNRWMAALLQVAIQNGVVASDEDDPKKILRTLLACVGDPNRKRKRSKAADLQASASALL